MANKGIVTGTNNFVGASCQDVNIIGGADNIVDPFVTNLTVINCTSINFNVGDSNSVWVDGGRVIKNKSTISTSSAPTFVNGDYNLYYIDASVGNVTIYINYLKVVNLPITFKVIDATNNIIFHTLDDTGQFEFNALPYTYVPNLGDSLTTVSDGTDIFII